MTDPEQKQLNVFYERHLVGFISSRNHVDLTFQYSPEWTARSDAFPISVSLPLNAPIPQDASNFFFVNLLPEENIRRRTCEKLGISEGNHFELLRRIGGDCAGALTISDANDFGLPPPKPPRYILIEPDQLAEWSTGNQYAFTQVAGAPQVRLSLAGAQDKLPVKFDGQNFFVPVGSTPSTHILKFSSHFSHLPENETFTTLLAKTIGLPVVDIRLHPTSQSRIAVVKRYDRHKVDGELRRIHQEDFCQALGIHPEQKYQQEGGPDLKACANLIKQTCSVPILELDKLLRWVLFNWLVHNADAHAKNISLLFSGGTTTLAPLL